MPVRAAGPRLFKSIKFEHLVVGAAAGGHGPRSSNVALNLTPFVDMMTILVTFLLMVFGSDTILTAQKGLDLPLADSKEVLQQAPVIIVTKTEITYQGQLISTVDAVMRDDSPMMTIDALVERLTAAADKIKADVETGRVPTSVRKICDDLKNGLKPAQGEKQCPLGLVILQADEATDIRLINKVVNTAKVSGFDNLLFAVKNK